MEAAVRRVVAIGRWRQDGMNVAIRDSKHSTRHSPQIQCARLVGIVSRRSRMPLTASIVDAALESWPNRQASVLLQRSRHTLCGVCTDPVTHAHDKLLISRAALQHASDCAHRMYESHGNDGIWAVWLL